MARKTKEEAARTREQIIDAARQVFHECGVGRSTLDKVAKAAGVTRGAVYWHFKDKAELFLALREDVFAPMQERTDALLFSEDFADPLDAIQAAMIEFFRVLDECSVLREVFEIMVLRCEYVAEFASVLDEANRPSIEFRTKIENVYLKAAAKGTLRPGLEPIAMARDTWAFSSGLLHLYMDSQQDAEFAAAMPAMISSHMALRRRV